MRKYGDYAVKDMTWNVLTGKEIRSIEMSKDKTVLKLVVHDGAIFVSAVGDCCSQSWFEHISGLDAVLGQTILKIVERKMPEGKDEDGDLIQYYGWTIETSKGRMDIEMRNRSNGYYGGEVIISDVVSGQYHCELDEVPETIKLTEDF